MAYWGFDTASTVTSSMIDCLSSNGAPSSEISFILRYVDTLSGVHDGLTSSEVSYIHGLGISLGLIYGSIPHESLTFQDGVDAANSASQLASDLGAPEYVTIYADLGTSYDGYVTADFIEGWAYQLAVNTAYHPGFYGSVGTDSDFDDAFSTAYNDSTYGSYVADAQLWSSEPEPDGCTTISGIPSYDPNEPPNTSFGQPQVWQYAESCGCNIDEDQSTLAPGNERWWNS